MVDEAIDAAEVSIVNGRLRLNPLSIAEGSGGRRHPHGAVRCHWRGAAAAAVDARTRFLSLVLERDPVGAEEPQVLYAAVLAMGTNKNAAEMARMVDGVSDDRIELAMRTVEEVRNLRGASDAVAAAMFAHPIAAQWGSGLAASADMMSSDSRRLWLARIESRRRGPAVGTYTHVGDRWAVI